MKTLFLFPLLAISMAVTAYYFPEWFVDLKTLIVPMLMAVMFLMGLQLRWQDFLEAWGLKKIGFAGVVLQFMLMPASAYFLAKSFDLSEELLIGLLLVGATAGGTASNLMTYLAGGKVALSVMMTAISTLAAVVLMPLLIEFYIGSQIDVPVMAMLFSLLKIIVIPIALGMFIAKLLDIAKQNQRIGNIDWMEKLTPVLSMGVIALIIAIVVALNQQNLNQLLNLLVLVIILHNLIGLLGGYSVARLLGYDSIVARTVAIEVGMQNSGLSVSLALQFFSPISALPGALFSLWHNLSGIAVALYFKLKN
jgi:BASS family bile acid:Na+ symporter